MWMLLLLMSLALAQDDVPSLVDLLPDVPSFSTTKKRMYVIHAGQPTIYCSCDWEDKVVDLSSCGLEEYDTPRWKRTEAEHVVPASTIGATRDCWVEGRSYCLKHDDVFKAAHNDLHNLRPAVGQINGYRSNNSAGRVDGEPREWGSCDFERDLETDRVEVRKDYRGDFARIHFYMEWLHGVPIPPWQRPILLHDHIADPVSDEERALDAAIEAQQGNSNPFVQ